MIAPYARKSLISYSLLAFCLSFIGLPIYIYLPNYYADNFSISLQTIAFILLITRLIDTIQDPLLGLLSDKYTHLRKRIICYLCPLLGITFLLLFYPLSNTHIEWWLGLSLVLTYSLFSLIYINYQAYAVNLSNDYHYKTKIISYRETAFIIGIILAATIPSVLFHYFSEPQSFLLVGAIFFLLISLFALIFFYHAPTAPAQISATPQSNISIKHLFAIISHDAQLKYYFLIFLCNAIASSIPAVLILFFVEEVLNAKSLVGLFLVLYFFGLLIGLILWTKLSIYLNDKVKTFTISICSTIIVFIWCYFLDAGDSVLYAIICLLSGIGFGGDFALSYSILTDLIQKNQLQEKETTLFGISNFIIKLSLTLCSSLLIYGIGVLENDTENKIQFIAFSYALIPIIFRGMAAFILYKKFSNN